MKISTRKIFDFIKAKFLYHYFLRKNIQLGKNVLFSKKPFIDIHEKSSLIIGDNVTINSDNRGYHVNMFAPCKLVADKPYALIEIGKNTRFHGSCIHAHKKVSIGRNCLIAANCQIIDGNAHSVSFPDTSNRINTSGDSKNVIIEDNVWLATGVIVLPGVTIGMGSIITANSVVHKDVPPMVIAGGNPINIIKTYGKQ